MNFVNNKAMEAIEKILFEKGDYQEKKSQIEALTHEDLLDVQQSTCKKIMELVANEYGRFIIKREFRKGNDWNSEVEGLSIVKDTLYVDL